MQNDLPICEASSSEVLPSPSKSFTFLDTSTGKSGLDIAIPVQNEECSSGDRRQIEYQEWDLSENCIKPYHTVLVCQECGKVHEMTFGCGSRFDSVCPSCAQKWRDKTAKQFAGALYWFKKPKMLTLTLWKDLNHPYDLVAVEHHIWKLFHQLRRILWEVHHIRIERFQGLLELPNHVHVIIDSRYIPFPIVQEVWKQLTFGQSWHVNIRAINLKGSSPKNVIKYVTKYVTKTKYELKGRAVPIYDLDQLRHFRLKQSWNCPRAPHPSICHPGSVRLATYDESLYRHFDNLDEWLISNGNKHKTADNG